MRLRFLDISVKFLASIFVLLAVASVGLTVFLQNRDEVDQVQTAEVVDQIADRVPINGINVLYYKPADLENVSEYSEQFITRLASLGTTHIAVAIPFFMGSNDATMIFTQDDTPDVEDVEALIIAAQAQDIDVIIKPIIDGVSEDFSRPGIAPVDVDEWFASYQEAIQPYVDLSQKYTLDSFVVGVELSSMQQYAFKWSALIANFRESYSGNITYAANWDAVDVPFKADLDYFGVDAYYTYEGDIDNAQMKLFWHSTFDELTADQDEGFIIHEYGIPSEQGAQIDPWEASGTGVADQALQDAWLRAACDVIHQRTRGGYIWSAYFGTNLDETREDRLSYNILGKPQVENTVRDCFSWY